MFLDHCWWKWRFNIINLSQDLTQQVIEKLSEFMGGSNHFVTILPNLVIITILVEEFLISHMICF